MIIRGVAVGLFRLECLDLLGGHKAQKLLSGRRKSVRFSTFTADRIKFATGTLARIFEL